MTETLRSNLVVPLSAASVNNFKSNLTDNMVSGITWTFATSQSGRGCRNIRSRDRTIWFRSKQAPAALFSSTNQPLREIFFPGHDHPVFVHQKHRARNNVTPPSIAVKQTRISQSVHIDLDTAALSALASATPNLPSSTTSIPLARPAPTVPFEEWTQVSKTMACKVAPPIPEEHNVAVKEINNGNTQAFIFTVHPNQYELAFHPLDDEDDGECLSCNVTMNDTSVRVNPLYPSDTIARMLEQHCMIKEPKILAKRPSIRKRMKQQQVRFVKETDPETRLAMIAAHPRTRVPLRITQIFRRTPRRLRAANNPTWSFTGLSLNINGLNKPHPTLYRTLLSRYQSIALQETRLSSEDNRRINEHFFRSVNANATLFWSPCPASSSKGRNGVGLLLSSAHPFGPVVNITARHLPSALHDRYLILDTSILSQRVWIHVVYAPAQSSDQIQFFTSLPTDLPRDVQHIVLGDFNVPLDPTLDLSHLRPAGTNIDAFLQWNLHLGLVDAWRLTHPSVQEYTGPGRRNRLDYCFLSTELFQSSLTHIAHDHLTQYHLADHLPVTFLLQHPDHPGHSRQPWKFPTWLFRVPEVCATPQLSLHRFIRRLRTGPLDNPGAFYDEHKRDDLRYLRSMFRRIKASRTKHIHDLQEQLHRLEIQEALEPSPTRAIAFSELQERIMDLSHHRKQSAAITHLDRDITQSERASKYFFCPPTPTLHRVCIPSAHRPDGTITTDPAQMAHAHNVYWADVFQSPSKRYHPIKRSHNAPAMTELLRHTTASLSSDDRRFLESPFIANDFYWAIKSSKPNKAPGYDGLPIEYYQLFVSEWACVLELVHPKSLEKGRMTKFQRRASITLLYKNGDRSQPSYYRPITLLNHDAKLGPKILAYRLTRILTKLLHSDQNGFVQGRSIRHALVHFQDIHTLCRLQYRQAGAILLDFAKGV
uniref:Pollike protein putative n=1 Tax=Albugo laibachii Nc14 TaxID=890382 RepID=F0WGB5_9STRA|nr:pollike protein putative [Albugo laibachii Nc14]|eukprot:CCA20275.1 pollike protein putative [Albugo laibachii Nc14]